MENKKIKSLKSLKSKLKKALPNTIMKVVQSYENFLQQNIPEDAKGFGTHHNACKSAVIHIETLLKLAKWTEEDLAQQTLENNNISELIKEAKEDFDRFEDDED